MSSFNTPQIYVATIMATRRLHDSNELSFVFSILEKRALFDLKIESNLPNKLWHARKIIAEINDVQREVRVV